MNKGLVDGGEGLTFSFVGNGDDGERVCVCLCSSQVTH